MTNLKYFNFNFTKKKRARLKFKTIIYILIHSKKDKQKYTFGTSLRNIRRCRVRVSEKNILILPVLYCIKAQFIIGKLFIKLDIQKQTDTLRIETKTFFSIKKHRYILSIETLISPKYRLKPFLWLPIDKMENSFLTLPFY